MISESSVRNVVAYLFSVLFYEAGRTLPHTILPIIITQQLGGSGSSVLALQIVLYLAIFLFEIPSGILSDVGI